MDGGYGSETGLVTVREGGGFVKAIYNVGQLFCYAIDVVNKLPVCECFRSLFVVPV